MTPASPVVLVVEDDQAYRSSIRDLLKSGGYEVCEAADLATANRHAQEREIAVVLLDLQLRGESGMDFLATHRERLKLLPVIVVTGNASSTSAIAAMQQGAFDYMKKGEDRERLLQQVQQAVQYRAHAAQALHQPATLDATDETTDILLGSSIPMLEVYKSIGRLAQSNDSVLITGETGTGKELIARKLHRSSARSQNPFVALNAANLNSERCESELFGHERGAFTGANATKVGLIECAEGGTLLIDEIGEIAMDVQPKLLRFLEDSTFRRMGGLNEKKADVRILAATHRRLEDQIEKGQFREDLYFRLNVTSIKLPPLRERREDIPRLVWHLLRRMAEKAGRQTPAVLQETITRLVSYDWPGNVRQLDNILRRASSYAWGGLILPEDAERAIQSTQESPGQVEAERWQTLDDVVDEVSRRHILKALVKTHWNVQQAAILLGINRDTVSAKMHKYGLEKPK